MKMLHEGEKRDVCKEKTSKKELFQFREKIKGKTLMDDRFMSAFFSDFPEGVELVLQIIMDKPDLKVLDINIQNTMTNLYGRSIRLDVLAQDTDGAYLNIEIQKSNRGTGFKRARYHSSMLDTNYAKLIGENFDGLPKTIVIFICENDIIGAGKSLYTINRVVNETGEIFDDDAHIIYVNGQRRDSETKLGRLLQDFFNPEPETMNYSLLANKSKYLKEDEEGIEMVREYLTEEEWNKAIAEGKDIGIKIGIEQGIEQGVKKGAAENAIKNARSLLILGKVSKEDIASCTGLSVELVNKLADEIKM